MLVIRGKFPFQPLADMEPYPFSFLTSAIVLSPSRQMPTH